MKIVDLTQRTPAWVAWRNRGVTATDAAVLLGSPFKTPWRLWAEKRGLVLEPDLSRNPHVQRGVREEPEARRRFEARHGELLLPVCAEATEEPIVRASFDGLTEDGRPVELKAPTAANFREAVALGPESVLYRRYFPQLQAQIFVAEADGGVLSLHCGSEFLDLDMPRDDACIARIVERARAFWPWVETGQEPPLDPEKDLYIPTGKDRDTWIRLAAEYRWLDQERASHAGKVKATEKLLAEKEQAFLALMGEFAVADSGGLRISRFLQQGAIDYKAALKKLQPELAEAELEAYRRKASERVRITVRQTDEPAGKAEDPPIPEPVAGRAGAHVEPMAEAAFWF